MEPREFSEWLAYHGAAYPHWEQQIAALKNPSQTLAVWRKAFLDVTYEACKQATDEMITGALGKRPYEIQDHVALICSRAKEIDAAAKRHTYKFHDPESYRCLQCRDDGIVLVLDPRSIGGDSCRAAVWCSCDSGFDGRKAESQLRAQKSPHVPASDPRRYEEGRFVKWSHDESAMQEAAKDIRPGNYETSFDDWNREREEAGF